MLLERRIKITQLFEPWLFWESLISPYDNITFFLLMFCPEMN